jgi:hypothetical protein
MSLDGDIRAAWGNQGDVVSKEWLIYILLEMVDRIEVLERMVRELNPGGEL